MKISTTFKCARCSHSHTSDTLSGAMVKAKMHWATQHGGIPDRAEEVVKEYIQK